MKGECTMIQIMLLPNPERFLSVVNRSQGDVFLRLPDHSCVNLKENEVAQQMIRMMDTTPEGLCIDVTDKEDIPSFMRYLTESALEERAS